MGIQRISEYILGQDLTNETANNLWGFCKKEGSDHEFFIKQFLSPKYPTDSSSLSPKLKEKKRSKCEEFFNSRGEFYKTLLHDCRTGNVVVINNFFRSSESYYIVTDKVENAKADVHLVSQMDVEKKRVFLAALVYSIAKLHERGIVHADLKPDNILLKKTKKDGYAPKIIDFDGSFFINEPGNINGDQVYLSPEFARKLNDEDVKLTEKLDVFALGILIHQYWTGELPKFDKEKYGYVHEAVLDGSPITLSSELPLELSDLIRKMLSKEPEDRPSATDIHELLVSNVWRKPEPIPKPIYEKGGFEPI